MAKWIKFTKDHDHRWPSRAVTAFKEGNICYVKDDVAKKAIKAKAAKVTPKPDDDDPNYLPTRNPDEAKGPDVKGNPDLKKAPKKSVTPQAGEPVLFTEAVTVDGQNDDNPATEGGDA